jgi:charged multivesicular body protein 1
MPGIEDQIFNMKFAAKSLVRESKKMEKEAKKSKTRCKKEMEKGNMEVAKIYAQNSIRQKQEALNLLKLSSRLDAVAARVSTAARMNQLTKGMKTVVGSMSNVLSQMKVEEITRVMDTFEKQFEDLDVRAEYMENAMQSTNATLTPENDVEDLMAQIADENDIEFQSELDTMKIKKKPVQEEEEEVEEDDFESRLKKLQGI